MTTVTSENTIQVLNDLITFKYFGEDFSIDTEKLSDNSYKSVCYAAVTINDSDAWGEIFRCNGSTQSEAYNEAVKELKRRLQVALSEMESV